jgi:hypothetical protein
MSNYTPLRRIKRATAAIAAVICAGAIPVAAATVLVSGSAAAPAPGPASSVATATQYASGGADPWG